MAVDKSMHVLVVDDYKTMVRIIGNLLGQLDVLELADLLLDPVLGRDENFFPQMPKRRPALSHRTPRSIH